MNNKQKWFLLIAIVLGCIAGPTLIAQLQQSGGPGSTVTANQGGTWTVQPGNTANTIAWKVDNSGVTQPVSGTFWQATQPVSLGSLPTLAAGTNNVGLVRSLPSSCTQSTNFAQATAQVATGAGSTVTSTTTCVTFAYANNITNSPVTLRIADKQGTPVIWLGGNADFTIPANSNMRIPIEGVTFTSGITAIAGTSSAVNLQINGVQ